MHLFWTLEAEMAKLKRQAQHVAVGPVSNRVEVEEEDIFKLNP